MPPYGGSRFSFGSQYGGLGGKSRRRQRGEGVSTTYEPAGSALTEPSRDYSQRFGPGPDSEASFAPENWWEGAGEGGGYPDVFEDPEGPPPRTPSGEWPGGPHQPRTPGAYMRPPVRDRPGYMPLGGKMHTTPTGDMFISGPQPGGYTGIQEGPDPLWLLGSEYLKAGGQADPMGYAFTEKFWDDIGITGAELGPEVAMGWLGSLSAADMKDFASLVLPDKQPGPSDIWFAPSIPAIGAAKVMGHDVAAYEAAPGVSAGSKIATSAGKMASDLGMFEGQFLMEVVVPNLGPDMGRGITPYSGVDSVVDMLWQTHGMGKMTADEFAETTTNMFQAWADFAVPEPPLFEDEEEDGDGGGGGGGIGMDDVLKLLESLGTNIDDDALGAILQTFGMEKYTVQPGEAQAG